MALLFHLVSEATEDREAVPENRDFKCKNGIVILQIEGEIGRQSVSGSQFLTLYTLIFLYQENH